ncbi:Hypothetical predicted protein [Cloeon dipterum]|uniref:Uncharacterized protein n=1 Tax=Cloeon dipterum TaxID=197152 RepID=A0A8S1CF86_9INSE|nr:Hypothetical predicted protein [Cloeon dipterum]
MTEIAMNNHERFVSGFWLDRIPLPVWHSSTVLIKINSTRKRFVEEAFFKNVLLPYDHFEGPVPIPAVEKKEKRFKASMALTCTYDPRVVRLIPKDVIVQAVRIRDSSSSDDESDI